MIVLYIPDTHGPFMHKDALDFLSIVKREYKPDRIVHLGDEADQHALGDWPVDPDGMSAGDEHRELLVQMKGLYKLFPTVQVCESNHSKRPYRRALKCGIPKAYIKAYKEFMEAPVAWSWHEYVETDSVLAIHGEGYSGAAGALKAATSNRRSTVIGHIHSYAGVQYMASSKDTIFAMNAGCLIDLERYAFAYGKTHASKPVMGCGVVIDGREARFIPL